MAKSHLKLVAPTTEKRTVTTSRRPKNAEVRTREYLTDAEVARLTEAAKANRYHRDATMILVAYRHGLRASELTDLQWNQIDFDAGTMAVRRAKKGSPNTHPIRGDELRALRRLAREQDPKSPFVFTSERGATFTTAGFARMVERAGEPPISASRRTRICYAMPAASLWPTRDTILALSRHISGTRTFSTPCAIPSWRRIGSRTSGAKASARPCTH